MCLGIGTGTGAGGRACLHVCVPVRVYAQVCNARQVADSAFVSSPLAVTSLLGLDVDTIPCGEKDFHRYMF